MTIYIVNRLLQGLATLVMLSILFFLLVRYQAGSPCLTLGCTEHLRLDEPVSAQYADWMGQILHGDFGTSQYGQPIGAMILQKLPPTVLLAAVSLILQQVIALPLGIFAALRPYSPGDQGLTIGSYIALSIPAFIVGALLISAFTVHWQIFPVGHYEDATIPVLGTSDWFAAVGSNPGYILGDLLRHLVLPAITLTVTGIAIDSRFMRAAMLQVLRQEYIRTAKSKGLRRRAIVFKHAFRNALLPIITNLGLYLPALIGGVVVVETVFTWGGVGYAFNSAIGGGPGSSDTPVLQALVMLSALAVVVANLLADLAYAWLDPRIRYGKSQE